MFQKLFFRRKAIQDKEEFASAEAYKMEPISPSIKKKNKGGEDIGMSTPNEEKRKTKKLSKNPTLIREGKGKFTCRRELQFLCAGKKKRGEE